ncbi:hypothetical protein [Cupriavidus sp. CP313]
MKHPDNLGAPGAHAAAPAPLYSRPRKTFLLAMLLLSWILGNADRMAMSVSIRMNSTSTRVRPACC